MTAGWLLPTLATNTGLVQIRATTTICAPSAQHSRQEQEQVQEQQAEGGLFMNSSFDSRDTRDIVLAIAAASVEVTKRRSNPGSR